jgi:hypothetical protein
MDQMTAQILKRLLAGQEQMMAVMKAEMETKQESKAGLEGKIEVKMKTNKEEMTARLEAKIEAKLYSHHDNFEVLRGTFVSGMDIQEPRTESTQQEITSYDGHTSRDVEVAIHSMRSELEETSRLRVEDQCDM